MTNREYVPATAGEAAHLRELAEEFERGFDVDELRAKRVPGHPLVLGAAPAATVTVRLLPDMLARLDEASRARHQTRSEVIRDAIERELAA